MTRAIAPRYDLFKLVVTIVLILILLLMLLRGCATGSAARPPTADGVATEPAGPEMSSPVPTDTPVILASDTPEILLPSVTPTLEATATPTSSDVALSPTPTVTESPAAETTDLATVTPVPEGTAACNTSVPSRLSVGDTARVVQRLNMRDAASITAPILQTNSIDTQAEIIGGPVCTPVGDRAYLWWQIRLANGAEGWSAESPLNEATYLLEPIQ